MKEQALTELMNKLGQIPEDSDGTWLQVSCPLAHITHESGKDEHPSCGISITEEKESVVNCFVCGTRKLSHVLHVLYWTSGLSRDVMRFFLENEFLNKPEPSLEYQDKFALQVQEQEKAVSVPLEVLKTFSSLKFARKFIEERGISTEVARKHKLLDYKTVHTLGVAIPIRDIDYQVYHLHVRLCHDKTFFHLKPKHFNIECEDWGRKDAWFGIEFIDWTKPVICVEGEMDAMRLETLGWDNVIASCGSIHKGSKKIKRLAQFEPRIVILGFDADEAGKQSKEVAKYWLNNSHIIDLNWSIVGIKDAGELVSKEDLEKVWQKGLKCLTNQTPEYRDKWRSNYDLV